MSDDAYMSAINEMDRRLMGVNGLNFADVGDSSPRKQMFSSHIGQCLVVKGGTERFIQTGMERQYAKTTFSVKMPEDGIILKVIPRYQETLGSDSIKNPETILIYESQKPGQEIGMIRLPGHFSDQTYFGFEYQARKITNSIRTGMPIAKGTVLLDSPSVTESGDYKYGVQCRVAYMSHPAVSEDGILVSRDVLKKFAIKTYRTYEVEWGSRYFPLNLYGDPNDPSDYRPFPNIGDVVRGDGLLMVLRREDRSLSVVQQSVAATREVDFFHDRRIYANGAGGKVVDIKIYHDDYTNTNMPEEMERQPMRYHRASQRFYREVVDTLADIEKRRGGPDRMNISKPLHALAVEACAILDNRANGSQERRQLLHRKNPLDDWRVEFTIEYEIIPTEGFKITDCHGGKGVICKVVDPEDMPVDENGVRAEIVMDGNSTNSRMNVGRLYEHFFNAASANVSAKVRDMLGLLANGPGLTTRLQQMETTHKEQMDRAWDYILGYLKIMSPNKMYPYYAHGEVMTTQKGLLKNTFPRTMFMESVINGVDGFVIYWPPENPRELSDAVRMIQANPEYRPLHGPVTYRGYSGQVRKTKNKVRIASVYIIMLEKIADDWTSVSSSKRQHFGVISQITSWDKHSSPQRVQAIRAWGESEVRISVSFPGPRVTADILDRNNNPRTARHLIQNLLQAPFPTNIEQIVDRKVVPYGGNKPLQLVKHMALCGGWSFEYAPYVPGLNSKTRELVH
jgi:hypothetical protein